MKNNIFTLFLLIFNFTLFAQEKAIINNSDSPNIVFKSVNFGDCHWTEGFWADKFKVCEEVMMPHMGTLLKGDIGHAYNNFKIAAGIKDGEHQGELWHDGDFYKWMESAMYIYAQNGDKEILQELDEIIGVIAQAQEEDGYISTQVQTSDLGRFSNRKHHELYNSGHLLTSACIHKRLTGQDNFLKLAVKHADYLYDLFQPQPDSLKRFGFNQSQIMGLVEMYRTVGDHRYLELAETFINMRGRGGNKVDATTKPKMVGDMVQERIPLRKSKEATGHAVLALYYYAGAADVYAETGEKALIDALDLLWEDVTTKKMYVTGAVGQTHHGLSKHKDVIHEGFINEYMMPNLTAYNETCANIANAMFSYRMMGIHGDAKYGDIMELVLFNSALSGISIEGKDYFYVNPLRKVNGALDYKATAASCREPYIDCFCCPPNLVRTIAKSSGWAYSLKENGLVVNMFGGNALDTRMLDGAPLKLRQSTNYPWEGVIDLTIEKCKKSAFEILLRIPAWANTARLMVNGKEVPTKITAGTFAVVNRQWKKGDQLRLELPMEVKYMQGNARIEEVRNQVAVQRGPVVYCVETPDLPKGTDILEVHIPEQANLEVDYQPDFLGGLSVIHSDLRLKPANRDKMYQPIEKNEWKTYRGQLIPYFAWSNRGDSEMTVWMPIIWN
ncbi:glycoside hydrolase family 127 protein [Persicobacter diffluens]|uniref:ATP-binding protein n=1 Tax=Persicobacter diffluens TaxID=981 RepID=A0AAN4W1V3_9BACT|nr:ATP-binding protein [Persicobacter diffluens]